MATMLNPNAIPDGSITQEKIDASVLAAKQDTLQLTVKDNGNIVLANLQGQSKEFMPATPSGDPMHWAYVAAGAEYNDTGADITKTAPWADMVDDEADAIVTHKAGYWYLNGLGDLSNEDIKQIYLLPAWGYGKNNNYLQNIDASVNLKTNFCKSSISASFSPVCAQIITGCANIVVLNIANLILGNHNYTFFAATKLEHIIGIVKMANATIISTRFTYLSTNIISVKLQQIKQNAELSNLSRISCKSILYMINNEAATTNITITLHPDAYARAMANADIVAALEAHPNISLASA